MKAIKFSLREKILLGILIICVLGYGYYQILYLPLNKERLQLMGENQNLQQVLQQNSQINQKIISGEIDLEKIQEEYEHLHHKLPVRPCIPEAIIFLEEAAQENKVTLLSINHKGDKHAPEVNNELQTLLNTDLNINTTLPNQGEMKNVATTNTNELGFSLQSAGSFFATTSYLLEIENASRLYIPERLLLQAGKKSSPQEVTEEDDVRPSTLMDSYNIMMDLELLAFYNPQEVGEETAPEKGIPRAEGKENPFSR